MSNQGSIISNGLVSQVSLTDTTNTDNSRAYSLADYSSGPQVGLRITAGDLSGATINSVDPGALAAAQSIANQAIQSEEASTSRIAGAASLALDKAFGLAEQSAQSDSQTLFNALFKYGLILLGLGGIGLGGYYIYKRSN